MGVDGVAALAGQVRVRNLREALEELGPTFENRAVVEKGLEPGDLLVTKGHQLVDPGDRVQVVNSGGDGR